MTIPLIACLFSPLLKFSLPTPLLVLNPLMEIEPNIIL